MLWLLLASMIWAFSFGLIGKTLAGVPASFQACARLVLAACVFLPFLRRLPARHTALLMAIGAVQFGLMYLCYLESYAYLRSHEVALFTVFTPVYVTLLYDGRRRHISWNALLAALLATIGAGVVLWRREELHASWYGFLLVQASNLCFAVGQLVYREWARAEGRPNDSAVMGWLYLGGMLVTLPWMLLASPHGSVSLTGWQVAAIIYLGLIASGMTFFLWNAGARRTSASLLAILNNLKIPLAVLVSICFFGETARPWNLLCAGILLGTATWFSQRAARREEQG